MRFQSPTTYTTYQGVANNDNIELQPGEAHYAPGPPPPVPQPPAVASYYAPNPYLQPQPYDGGSYSGYDRDDVKSFQSRASSAQLLPAATQGFGAAPPTHFPPNPYQPPSKNAWRPGFWIRFPYLGVLSLIGTVGCAIAALCILLTSNGKVVGSWGYGLQPNAYLAIMSLISTMFLTFAFGQGLVLSFWRKSVKGATLANLHMHWASGNSIIGAVRNLFRGRGKINAIAFILWMVSVLRAPLNQEASSIGSNVAFQTNGSMSARMASQLPEGYTGITPYSRAYLETTAMLTPDFTNVTKDYNLRTPVRMNHTGCGDSCTATVQGFGFCGNCTTYAVPFNYTSDAAHSYVKDTVIFSSSVSIFHLDPVNATSSNGYRGGLAVNTFYVEDPKKPMVNNTCYLYPATVQYNIAISNGTVTLAKQDWHDDRCVQTLSYLGPTSRAERPTTVGGFQFAADNQYNSSVTYIFGGAVSSTQFRGTTGNQYVTTQNATKTQQQNFAGDYTFTNPMDDIINTIRELAFRTSVYAATQNSSLPGANQTTEYTGTESKTIYVTKTSYMIAGFIFSILGVVGVIPLYHGWWHLGRDFSMSPLEIAKAFDAPLLRGAEANAGGNQIAREVGQRTVRYGEVVGANSGAGDGGSVYRGHQPGETMTLVFADAERVIHPRAGMHY